MSVNSENEKKVPPNLALTALLSSGITGIILTTLAAHINLTLTVVSVTYLILSILALVYRVKCDEISENETDNARFTWNLIYRVYIQDASCVSALPYESVTPSHTVFILAILTLCFSVLTLIASILLTVGVNNKQLGQHLNVIVPVYVTCWVGSLAVDLTLAVLLGMDYGVLTEQLSQQTEFNFILDSLRHGVFVLMSVALKGYVTIVINMILIGLLIAFLCQYQEVSKQEQHSIHKVGSINAFDQPRRVDNWVPPPEPTSPYASSYNRGMSTQSSHMYMNDDQPRSLPRSDHLLSMNQSFNRSESWQHQPPHHGSRPFSYMDEIRQTVPLKPATSPAPSSSQEPQWRRDPWQQAPAVPAPDYSPHSPRRLKSALKSGYM